MKKSFCAMSLVPSLLMATGVVFASSNGVTQLSDVSDSVRQIMQEGRPLPQGWQQPGQQPHPGGPIVPVIPGQQPGGDHNGPGGNHGGPGGDHNGPGGDHNGPGGDHGGNGGQPGGDHGGNGGQPGGDHGGNGGPVTPPVNPPVTPPVVDTTQARAAGMRDGAQVGEREGRREGYNDGVDSGEREGRRRGTDEGEVNGRNSGMKDGWGVDQAAGTQRGNVEGQNTGISNGTASGQKRCYDAGYTNGYNSSFATAQQLGLKDVTSYNAGYAKGQADAAVVESGNGQKAGYQAGFAQREAELQNTSLDMAAVRGIFARSALTVSSKAFLPIELARNGYTTPEEKRAYEEGYKDGYQRSYRRAYEDAKRDGYNERFQMAYRRAYDVQFSISYRNGFAEGKEKGYQEAYSAAYNSAYNYYFEEYSRRDYADQTALGIGNGQAVGQKEGFAAGCAELTKIGYKEGYEKTAAAVYPGAFNAGKLSGIAAADKYYSENSVLKVFNVSFYDENNNGKFEAGENVMMKAEVRNFGFQKSDVVTMVVKSDRGEIVLATDLRAEGVGGRAKGAVNLNVGKLFDVVAPDADALYVTFSEKGRMVGDARQMYTRTNPNKVGVVGKDGADVTKKDTWFFPGKITSLNQGEKVLILETKGSYYKVRKSAFAGGNWNEGFIKSDKLNLQ